LPILASEVRRWHLASTPKGNPGRQAWTASAKNGARGGSRRISRARKTTRQRNEARDRTRSSKFRSRQDEVLPVPSTRIDALLCALESDGKKAAAWRGWGKGRGGGHARTSLTCGYNLWKRLAKCISNGGPIDLVNFNEQLMLNLSCGYFAKGWRI
jgi:hypothetical protein